MVQSVQERIKSASGAILEPAIKTTASQSLVKTARHALLAKTLTNANVPMAGVGKIVIKLVQLVFVAPTEGSPMVAPYIQWNSHQDETTILRIGTKEGSSV